MLLERERPRRPQSARWRPLLSSLKPTRAAQHEPPESIPQSAPRECPLRFELYSSRFSSDRFGASFSSYQTRAAVCNFGD